MEAICGNCKTVGILKSQTGTEKDALLGPAIMARTVSFTDWVTELESILHLRVFTSEEN